MKTTLQEEQEKKEPKVLEKGESTYRNGGGSMCGGVMSESMFFSNIDAHMMAYYMEDDRFEEYKKAKADSRKFMQNYAQELFKKHARSFI